MLVPEVQVPQAGELPLHVWRKRLQQERAALKLSYLQNGNAQGLLRRHASLVDKTLKDIWCGVGMPRDHALIAVGGYGRGELFPHSDIDLLVLRPEHDGNQNSKVIEHLIGTLWDAGLEVGHSVRTRSECLAVSQNDLTVETTLREARRVIGSESEFEALRRALSAQHDKRRFFAAKMEEQRKRHLRYAETAYSLEPNLKEGPGGLRDLQNVLWLSCSAEQGKTWPEVARADLITDAEARQIQRHEQFLKNLRIRLHYLAERREDRLLFDYQTALAEQLGLRAKRQKLPSEVLMQRFYRTAKAVGFLNTILLHNLSGRIHPLAPLQPVPGNPRFQFRGDVLRVNDESLYQSEPRTIFETFHLLQQHPWLSGLSPTTLRALWRAKHAIGAEFRQDPENQTLFLDILRAPRRVTDVLRRMNQYGILGRYIPPFGRIVGQMQHDLYHVYTVDEHILKVVRNVRRFVVADFAHEFPFCSELIRDFARVEVLYLAALFHDIAKGRGGDHSTLGADDARRFCRVHNLPDEDTELVAWLVRHHLVMSATAQKQDLSDPEVIARFATLVGNERRLTALYLLTVADIRGTSPKVWNAWKGKLLEDLYRLTRRHLVGARPSAEVEIAQKQQEALRITRQYALSDDVHEAFWSKLDESYFRRHEAQEIAWHTRVIRTRVEPQEPIVKARLSPVGEGIQVMIYSRDREGLFARICGFFGGMNYNIVEADIYTTRHDYALDSFQIHDKAMQPSHYRDLLSYIEFELKDRLVRMVPLAEPGKARVSRQLKHFPIKPEVDLKPHDRAGYHWLSVTAGDRPGLLYAIACVFVKHRISLHTAKINTLGDRAEDMFMVSGEALEDFAARQAFAQDLMAQLQP